MGRKNPTASRRSHDAVNAERALKQIIPALKRVATVPENFSAHEKQLILDLLSVASLTQDPLQFAKVMEVFIALERQNQRRDLRERPTRV